MRALLALELLHGQPVVDDTRLLLGGGTGALLALERRQEHGGGNDRGQEREADGDPRPRAGPAP